VVKRILLVLACVALAGGILFFFDENANRPVSFTLCGGSVEKFDDGSRRLTIDTSAGRFLVTKPSLVRTLGGDKLKIGQKFDGEYDGSDVTGEVHQLKKVSSAKEPDKVPACK